MPVGSVTQASGAPQTPGGAAVVGDPRNVGAEFYDGYLWPTKAAAKLAVGDWIERVYNRRRRHSALGMISPVDFANRLTQTAQAA
jgi:transposase InsO family protein